MKGAIGVKEDFTNSFKQAQNSHNHILNQLSDLLLEMNTVNLASNTKPAASTCTHWRKQIFTLALRFPKGCQDFLIHHFS